MIKICNLIRKRIYLDARSLLARIQVLEPAYVKNIDGSPRSITDIAAHFPTLVPQEQLNQLDDEWREFRQAETAMHAEDTSIPSYWYQVQNVKSSKSSQVRNSLTLHDVTHGPSTFDSSS